MPGPITMFATWLKHVVVYENILVGFSVGHCEFKVNVTLALAKFHHFTKSPADGSSSQTVVKVIKDTNYISLTVKYAVASKAQTVRNLPCM